VVVITDTNKIKKCSNVFLLLIMELFSIINVSTFREAGKKTMIDINSLTLARYQQGHMDAFHSIYEQTSGFIYNVIYNLVNNPDDAAELTHDVYLKLFKAREKYDPNIKFTTWAYRIATNHALNSIKRHHVYLRKLSRYFLESPKFTAAPVYTDPKDKADVHHALSQLPDEQRIILILRAFDELSYDDIGDILNIELGTVKSRLNRAKKAFKDAYSKHKEVSHENKSSRPN
tara:strand:- start:291 stop:983 length:693 start_codon:yes stop_codon:yes gene_type:complete